MKKLSISVRVIVFFILVMIIFSICGAVVSHAEGLNEEGIGVTIEEKSNDKLIFHDYNELLFQNYYTDEDYKRIEYQDIPNELEDKFINEPHEEIADTRNLEIIGSDIEISHYDSPTEEIIPEKVFDIKRKVDSKIISTTYVDDGYYTVIKVDNNLAKLVKQDGMVDGISCDINGEFVSNGNYIRVNYVLKNNNSNTCKISLASFADIQIGTNDSATVTRQPDGSGIVMTDDTTNLQFKFFGRNIDGVTNIDGLWIGAFPYQTTNFFYNNDMNEFSGYDSAFAYSWKNRAIASGETQVYSVLYGVDELSAIPAVTIDKGQERYTSDTAEVTGKVTDINLNDSGKLYFNVDDGKQIYLGRYNIVNGKYDFSIDLSKMELKDGVYRVKVWAIDESGLISSVAEKDVVIGANTPIPKPAEDDKPKNIVNNIVAPRNDNRVNNNNAQPQKTNQVTNAVADNTLSEKTLPYTGLREKAGVLLFFSLIIARVIYVKYKKTKI